MYVEDLFLAIWSRLNQSKHGAFDGLLDDAWHRNFIANVSSHVQAGKQLSTKQSKTILKLIARVRHHIVHIGLATDDDVDRMLRQPEHRRPLYQSANIPREVRHLGDNLLGFRFKQNDMIVNRIKEFGQPNLTKWAANSFNIQQDLLPRPRFDWDHRIWIVPVWRHNIAGIIALLNEYQFGLDDATKTYLHRIRDSLDQASSVVLRVEHEVILANVCDNALLAGWMIEVAGGVAV